MRFAIGSAWVGLARLGFLAFGLCLLGAPARSATSEQWRADIDRLVLDIKGHHPDPFSKVGALRFARAADALKDRIASLTEEQRMAGAMALVAMLGDGHSWVEPNSAPFARWYPFRAYEFSDGYFITGAHKSAADLAGSQLLEVGSKPIAEAAAAARGLIGADNSFGSRERLHALHNAPLMTALGFARADGSMNVRLRLRDGKTVSRTLQPIQGQNAGFGWTTQPEYWGAVGAPEDWISAYKGLTVAQLRTADSARPPHLMYRRAFHATPLAGGKVYYIQSNVMSGTAEKTLPVLYREALAEVDRLRPDHLIVDIRQNFGGDGSYVPAVMQQFLARASAPPWKNLYLLTGRKTFSAGVLLTDGFIDHLRPTIVGEPAGAPLNHHGDANAIDYSDTGMQMFVSFERHQISHSSDLSEVVAVDYPASFSFADYAAGRDPAVDPIVAGQDLRSIPAIAAADGAGPAFAAFQERQARFGGSGYWRATSEIDLRTLMRELDDTGRKQAAIEVARLNTQINPREWRTWMNLGDLLIRAGRRAEAVENYRNSLALDDPTNFNTPRLRQAVAEFEREQGSTTQR